MLLPFITLTLASSFPPPLFLNRRLFLRFSSKVSPVAKGAMSSQQEPLPGGGNSAVHHDPVRISSSLSNTSHDSEEYIMIGSIRSPLHKTPKNGSLLPFSTRTRSNSSGHLPSPPTSPYPQHRKVKRKTRIDIGLTKDSGDNSFESGFGSTFENSNVSLTETMSTTRRRHDESPQRSHFSKEFASANLNYKEARHNRDSPVNTPKFEQYDICFRAKRNSPLIGSTFHEKNEESSIEVHKEGTKEGVLRPGMVLLKHHIAHKEQVGIVKICRELGLGPGGFYQPCFANGAKLRLKMMCLGMDWDPQTKKYGNKRAIDGNKPPTIPPFFSKLAIRAIQTAHRLIDNHKENDIISNVEDVLPSMTPDIGIVNFYTANGRLGLHQDCDESRGSIQKGLPVVSFSIGDSAEFLYGDHRDVENAESVILESGDVLIFGGDSRLVFHGVSSIIPDSAPKELLEDTWLRPGRLNLTFRQY